MQGEHSLLLLRADGEGQAVYKHVLFRNAVPLCGGDNPARKRDAFFRGLRHSLVAHGQPDDSRAVLFDYRQKGVERRVLRIHGIDDCLARIRAQSALHRVRLAAVYLQRRICKRRYKSDQPRQHLRLVYAGQSAVDVEYLRARLHLFQSLRRYIVEIAAEQRLLHSLFPRGIYAFADYPYPVYENRFRSGTDG